MIPNYKKAIKVIMYFFAIASLTVFVGLKSEKKAEAQNEEYSNITGYAWSSNIGWISFNGSNYGVRRHKTTGDLSGYAWSSNIGWLSFNRSDTGNPPSSDVGNGSGAISKVNGTNVLGWARFISGMDPIENGVIASTSLPYWDGWVSLNGSGYGVTLHETSGAYLGWAWGDEVVGWINFDLSGSPTPPQNPTCPPGACDGGSANPSIVVDIDPLSVDVSSANKNVIVEWDLDNIDSSYSCTKSVLHNSLGELFGVWGNPVLNPVQDGNQTVTINQGTTAGQMTFVLSCTKSGVTVIGSGVLNVVNMSSPTSQFCAAPANSVQCSPLTISTSTTRSTIIENQNLCPDYVANPNAPKCQFYCKSGFVKRGNQCIIKTSIEEN